METSRPYQLFFTALVIVCASLFAALCPENVLPKAAGRATALAAVTIFLLATSAIPEYLTALLFFVIAMLFDIAPAPVVFSGFSSTAFWLVFGGLILGIAISITGLGKRIALKLAAHLTGSYLKILTGMALVGLLFAFIMPSSMGRVLLLLPISSAVADHFGFREGTKGRTGVILVTTLSTFLPAFSIMPANVPNIILLGMAENQFDFSPLFGSWLVLHFPVLGLLKTVVLVAVVRLLYPDTPAHTSTPHRTAALSRDEKVLSGVLLLLLVLWGTDCFHRISPAWITLGGALFLLLPKPGAGIVSEQIFATRVNNRSLFFVAGVIGLGNLLTSSGAAAMFSDRLTALLPLSRETPFLNYIAITAAASVAGLFTTLPGVPAVMTPLSPELAAATGFSVPSVLMLQIVGISTLLLPYQAPPIVVAMQLANEKFSNFAKPVAVIAVLTWTVLLPVDYLWLRVTGWI